MPSPTTWRNYFIRSMDNTDLEQRVGNEAGPADALAKDISEALTPATDGDHMAKGCEADSTMRELIEPQVTARIYARAKGKCECENITVKHVAKHCRNRPDAKSGISLPAVVTTVEEKTEKGRAVCQECFLRSNPFYGPQPIIT